MSDISRKQAKLVFQNFCSFFFLLTGMWTSFPDVLNLIFALYNFANGEIRETKTYTVNILKDFTREGE